MNLLRVTLSLVVFLFVLPANSAWACGNDNTDQVSKPRQGSPEKSCCSKEENEVQTHCADDLKSQHSASECPCDHENGGCKCPGCGMISSSGAVSALEIPPLFVLSPLNFSVQKRAFYFADHLPEAVYLPIWQPPKINV